MRSNLLRRMALVTMFAVGVLCAQKAPATLPAFSLPDLDGKSVNSADWKGKVVVVDFWATWCVACREAFPILSGLKDKYGDRLVIAGISTDQNGGAAKVGKFAKKSNLNYLVLLDPSDTQSKVFGYSSIPALYVFGPDGKLLANYSGLEEENQKKLEALIAQQWK